MTTGEDSGGDLYCPNCGSEVPPEAVYCPSCGTKCRVTDPGEVEDGAAEDGATEDPDGESRAAFRRRVQDRVVDGWEIEHDGEDSVVVVDRGIGRLWVHVVLFMFTGGVGNAIYAWYKYTRDADRRVMRRGETSTGRGTAPAPTQFDDDGPSLKGTIGGFALVLLGLYVVATNLLEFDDLLFGLFLLFAGAYVMPQVRNRLADRHPVTTFGRTKSTDEEVVSEPDVPCSACLSPIESGVCRTYTEEQVFAGVPLFTVSSGENHYCRSCAAGEVPGSDDAADVADEASEERETA